MKITEAFVQTKAKRGETKFSKSSMNDPHIVKAIQNIADKLGAPIEKVQAHIQSKVNGIIEMGKTSPLLYDTIMENVVESEVYNLMGEQKVKVDGAPEFSIQTFYKLLRHISAENDEFWPLRGFVDRRPLQPRFEFVTEADNGTNPHYVPTAAATPSGTFIFNVEFMQNLLNYAHVKQITPQGKKYAVNGGQFHDGYSYIEFLIMHEFMHYSHDDFYYQKIIPNADSKVINWVGDFRSNYLLVKSGYEQLPMGLYSDGINYDNQATYIEMYNLVKAEFDKAQDKQAMSDSLDKLSDDHDPGQEEGKESDAKIPEDAGDKIDENGKKIAGEVKNAKDTDPDSVEKQKEKRNSEKTGDPSDKQHGPGQGGDNNASVDYSKIRPTFNWSSLLKKFITSSKQSTEETYTKPSRRGITGMDVARQTGAGAIKPAERTLDRVDLKLAFALDCSGSMTSCIAAVYSNARALLAQPKFAKSEVFILKSSTTHKTYKGVFAKNTAIEIYPNQGTSTTMTAIFKDAAGGGTEITTAMASDMTNLLANGYNVLMITDTDILGGNNVNKILALIKAHPRNMFMLFDCRESYLEWRKQTGIATVNITHF